MTLAASRPASLSRRVSIIGGSVVAIVMLGLCGAMAWVTSQQARGHAALYAREKALAAANAVDAFDGAARQMAERYHRAFADTMRGQFTLDDTSGQLSLDGDVLNDTFGKVDQFSAATGGVATVFARKGDDFVRISTSLKKQDGTRAVGTTLGTQHPAYAAMQAGQSYIGRAVLFGTPYMTRYQAVRDAAGKVVGILFIGFDVTALQGTLEAMVTEGKLYDTGGLAVIDPRKDLADAVFVAHGSAKGKKVAEAIPGAQATLAALQAAGDQAVPMAVPLVAPGTDRWAMVARSKLTGWWAVAEVSDSEAMRSHHRAAWGFAIAFGLATLALAGGLAWVMRRQVAEPLQALGTSLSAVAAGDLTQSVAVDRRDEIGRLAGQAEAMRAQLAATIAQVRDAAQSIRTASDEVATGNADLSQRTESTASSLQQTASAMEQLTGTVRQSADSATQANRLAASASEVASRGGEVVAQVVSTMDGISQASRRIADIIGTIDGIAFQTNILALNAAVEAARAGEQGRGFAVVASEVRSLAQRSAEAAREIKSLIGASVGQVETGAHLVREAGETMSEIVRSVRHVTDMIGEISAATHEQSQGIGQVNQTVSSLDHMTQQNAAMVEQSAAAARSMSEQAQRLATLVQQFRTP